MKIIHTADWHIGKVLHRQDLHEDITLFFDWLILFIKTENIDLLLISGDIFDLTNPSNRDLATYYKMLYRLSQTETKVIITGGNHDSISLLDAPSVLLDVLNITIIGGAKSNAEEEVIPYIDPKGVMQCVVLAVPFLRDKDLRLSLPVGEMNDKALHTEQAIKSHYDNLIDICTQKYQPMVPIIAMGHFYMKGAITSDSERDIHIGNLSGLDSNIIHHSIDYFALGHIHKPQKINNKENIRYCGSPLFLDFSERDYAKKIILLEINAQKITDIKSVPIPKFRDVIKLAGTLDEIKIKLSMYKNIYPLPAFLELEVIENVFDILKIQQLEDLKAESVSPDYRILKSRISFTKDIESEKITNSYSKSISELSPMDVFRKKLTESAVVEPSFSDLSEIYHLLLEELNQ
ncbi:MAG: exonuclease subunit SbcD [Saprospiraceae bacterium]